MVPTSLSASDSGKAVDCLTWRRIDSEKTKTRWPPESKSGSYCQAGKVRESARAQNRRTSKAALASIPISMRRRPGRPLSRCQSIGPSRALNDWSSRSPTGFPGSARSRPGHGHAHACVLERLVSGAGRSRRAGGKDVSATGDGRACKARRRPGPMRPMPNAPAAVEWVAFRRRPFELRLAMGAR